MNLWQTFEISQTKHLNTGISFRYEKGIDERDKSTISRHIKNVYSDKELLPEPTVAKFS